MLKSMQATRLSLGASQPNMPHARATLNVSASCVTPTQGPFFCLPHNAGVPFGHPIFVITPINSSFTNSVPTWATQAYWGDCQPSDAVRTETSPCFTGPSGASFFQATSDVSSSGGFAGGHDAWTLQAQQYLESTASPDNLYLQSTLLPTNFHHPKSTRVLPVVMDESPQSGNHGTTLIQPESSRSTEGPSAQQWQELKEEIKDLYSRKPLKDVRAILEQRYGFRAT